MNRREKITTTSAVTLVAALVGIWAAVPWSDVVPVTQAQHFADLEEIRAEMQTSETSIVDAIERFERKWECDEAIEELNELLEKERAGILTPQESERMTRLRDLIDEDDCADFE